MDKSNNTSKLFRPETWDADRKARFEIAPAIELFHRSVPALRFLDWSIEEIGRGFAVTRLPLNVQSSNQYITQQAALMLLAADYTGGIALCTLFRNAPVIGFHPQLTDYGAYLWGAAANIKWLRPSTDDLVLTSSIPERDWDEIAKTFEEGGEINYKARIKMFSGGRISAVSDFQYWARNSHSLMATGSTLATTHHMLAHKLKTSARLIAGLRAEVRCDNREEDALLDPYAATAAGTQGRAMAQKFSLDSPQLADLVRARTLHCDKTLRSFSERHNRFTVVNIGCGYDSRAWRMLDLGDVTFVELDLPVMLHDRAIVLPGVAESPYRVLRKPFDIKSGNLKSAIVEAGASLGDPIFIIWEGGSMYFNEPEADALLIQIRSLMTAQSEFWFDCVSSDAVADRTKLPEVKLFMDSMRMIGEPFVRGFENIKKELSGLGLNVLEKISAAEMLSDPDPVFEHYSFARCAS